MQHLGTMLKWVLIDVFVVYSLNVLSYSMTDGASSSMLSLNICLALYGIYMSATKGVRYEC